MSDTDAYGNELPKATRRQVNKEVALYRQILRELDTKPSLR